MSERASEIRLLKRKEISVEKWEDLCQSLDYPVFNSLWYLDSVFEDWQAFVLNDYELALPVFPKKKFHLTYSLQPLFVREIQIMGKSADKCNEFLEVVLGNFDFIEMNFNNSVKFEGNNESLESKCFQLLNFKNTYAETYNLYSENAKRKLKKFKKLDAKIQKIENIEELITIFIKEKGESIKNFTNDSYEKLKNIMVAARNLNCGELYGVRFLNEIVAIAFFINYKNHLLYLKGAVTPKGKDIGAMFGLFDFIIENNHMNYKYLDFGGSSNFGVATFNKKFGATDMKYLILKRNTTSWPINLLVKSKLGI